MARVALRAGYISLKEACAYTPKAFGVIAQHDPVPSTAVVSLDVQQGATPVEFFSKIPIPKEDECGWAVQYVKPTISVDGVSVAAFFPSMTVTGEKYLPKGDVTYYCELKNPGGKAGATSSIGCELRPSGTETIKIHIVIKNDLQPV